MFGGLKKMLFGILEMQVSGDTLVSEFENEFLRVFDIPIRVYNLSKERKIQSGAGGRRASKDALISDVSTIIAKGKSKKISIKDSEKVGSVEKKIESTLGIGVQILCSDGKGFADNNKTLKEIKDIKSDDLISLDVAVNSSTTVNAFTKAFNKACKGVSVRVWCLTKSTGKIMTGATIAGIGIPPICIPIPLIGIPPIPPIGIPPILPIAGIDIPTIGGIDIPTI